jgi:hypothetical protein
MYPMGWQPQHLVLEAPPKRIITPLDRRECLDCGAHGQDPTCRLCGSPRVRFIETLHPASAGRFAR